MRIGAAFRALLTLGLALRLHHQFEGPPIDYYGLAAAAAASWVGVPGPGEPVLIAAGLFAAKDRLDITSVIAIAWVAATVGGIAGWLIGMKAGRKVLITRGPLHNMRRKALARGDEVFERHPVIGVLLTPSWIAGIHRVRPRVFMLVNAASAALWAVGIGLGAYLIGPTIVDIVSDVGWLTAIGLGVLIAGAVWTEISRRRRKARGQAPTGPSPTRKPS